MPRKPSGTRGSGKAIIRVFCEGESEQAYTEFLRKTFSDVAVIKYPRETGLFEEAKNKFANDPLYRDYVNEIDEVWFFYDVETKDIDLWEQRLKIIKHIRGLRKKPGIRVRLLMTTGCVEYWFMLHFKLYIPPIQTVAEKERILNDLIRIEPTYKKGNYESTEKIASHYCTAKENAKKTVSYLLQNGLPCSDDTDERNRWLCKNCYTFSNVYEAIEFLQNLQ